MNPSRRSAETAGEWHSGEQAGMCATDKESGGIESASASRNCISNAGWERRMASGGESSVLHLLGSLLAQTQSYTWGFSNSSINGETPSSEGVSPLVGRGGLATGLAPRLSSCLGVHFVNSYPWLGSPHRLSQSGALGSISSPGLGFGSSG